MSKALQKGRKNGALLVDGAWVKCGPRLAPKSVGPPPACLYKTDCELQVMSLFIDLIQTTTKVYRTTSYVRLTTRTSYGKDPDKITNIAQPVILRCAALTALLKAVQVGGKSMSDQTLKDTLKALKAGLTDKAGAIVRLCAEVRSSA